MTKLDILSDPICPWCLIGKAHLERALEAHPEHDFVIEWHPYQLNPGMPREGMDRQAYLDAKFGPEEARAFYGRIAQAAAEAGLEVDFDAIKVTPNTIDAHRLIHWAGLEGKQNAIVTRLFQAYFRDGRNIGDPQVLVEIAAKTGMDATMVARLLASDADRAEIEQRDAHARERGVRGVPTFIVANSWVVTGAQPPELWAQVIEEIAAQRRAESVEG